MRPLPPSDVKRLLHSKLATRDMLGGIGDTKLVAMLKAGLLDAVKLGQLTMVTDASIQRYLASLPKALVGTGKAPARRAAPAPAAPAETAPTPAPAVTPPVTPEGPRMAPARRRGRPPKSRPPINA